MDPISLIKELPYMFAIIAIVWLVVAGITLRHIIVRKDINKARKWEWFFICLIPYLGVLFYGITHYRHEKRVLWTTLFATFASALSFWWFAIHVPAAERDTSNKTAEQITTAQYIIKEFMANEDLATKKYNNKIIELSGYVEKVESTDVGTTVYLATGIPSSVVSASLAEKPKEAIANGTELTIKGLCTGYIMGEIQLGEAVITKISGNAAPVSQPPATTEKPVTSTAPTTSTDTGKSQPAATMLTFRSKSGSINFKATDEVAATNSQVVSTITEKGDINFAVLIKGFRFEDALMQQHFNEEKYMNSEKFPKASFAGNITNMAAVNFKKDGSYAASVKGKLTIHGVTKDVQANGGIVIAGGKLSLNSSFKIAIADFGVTNTDIADQAEITVSCSY